MNWLVIENIRPWDGRYEFDIENEEPTTREWSWIKRFSGYLPLTIQQGLEGGDPELFCAFAILALRRAGKIEPGDVQQVYDRLADVPFGATIRLEADEPVEEGDAGPPPENSNGSSSITGPDSRPSSDRSAAIPPASGIPASATSTSARPASVR